MVFPLNTPYNHLLNWSLVFFAIPWLYSYFNEQHRQSSMPVEQAILKSWERVISQPTIKFRKIIIGINCNVDVIVPGVALLNHLNYTKSPTVSTIDTGSGVDTQVLNSVEDLYSTFSHFFSKGAPAERYMADEAIFKRLVALSEEKSFRTAHHIGGNAALMAQKIAASFPATTAYLVGPIGPRSEALLHPSIVRNNSTRIGQDEMHLILEYKQGEIFGEYVAPASSRFITSHDQYSGSSLVIDMFFKAILTFRPDLIVFSGVHLLEAQPKEIRIEKLRHIKRSLLQINPLLPIHLQLGSMGDDAHGHDVLYRIIPNVDSLSINEQELAFLSKAGGGPFTREYPVSTGALHVYKVVDMLHWLLSTFGHDPRADPASNQYNYRLQRIHFHCLTYHIMIYRGTDWSNLASGLAAGARLAGRQACNMQTTQSMSSDAVENMFELRTSQTVLLDRRVNKVYQFNAHAPFASWQRNESIFIYTPVLICKFPQRTVGIDDAISAAGLLYSQFYRMEKAAMMNQQF